MRALVVYESMFGNTHRVAECIAGGLAAAGEARVVPVAEATDEALEGIDLLVVGGPTHVHGMTSTRSREAAHDQAALPGSGVTMDPDAEGPGLRDWFDERRLPHACAAAAFDTRMHGSPALTGRASKGIAKRLARHGARLFADPESFIVDRDNHLADGEAERAGAWGASLAEAYRGAMTEGRHG